MNRSVTGAVDMPAINPALPLLEDKQKKLLLRVDNRSQGLKASLGFAFKHIDAIHAAAMCGSLLSNSFRVDMVKRL